LALIGWLLCIALIIVATTAIASEFDRVHDAWAVRIRRFLRIEPGSAAAEPAEPMSGAAATSGTGA
jgi:membrane protein